MEDLVRYASVTFFLLLILAALVFIPISIVYLVINPIDRDAFYVIAFSCLLVLSL